MIENRLQILLIEDNRGDAQLIREIITDTGIDNDVTWINDGEKAVDYFRRGNRADIVILDLNLPKMNGHEVLGFLRSNGLCPPTPVVIMTGSTSPTDMKLARENGVKCYMVKPMTVEEMDETAAQLKLILLDRKGCHCE